MTKRLLLSFSACLALAALAAAAGNASGSKLKGTITADGSSTVGPYTTAAAEGFHKLHSAVNVTVGISGTGGGFERFCRGETDLSDASRPIKGSESKTCSDKGVSHIAFTVANDGISIVVNKQNTWAKCLTVEQLHKMWEPGSKVDNWRDVNPSYPDVDLKLFGPGTDSGTFDFFTEKINGKARASRLDYFGLSYYVENKSKLNLVRVNAGRGCVAPSIKTVQSKRYKPLSRPLFIYVKRTSFKRPEVYAFIGYILKNERAIATKARFVSLTNAQLELARDKFRGARR